MAYEWAFLGGMRAEEDRLRSTRLRNLEAFNEYRRMNPEATASDFMSAIGTISGGDKYFSRMLPSEQAVGRMAAENKRRSDLQREREAFDQSKMQLEKANMIDSTISKVALMTDDPVSAYGQVESMLPKAFQEDLKKRRDTRAFDTIFRDTRANVLTQKASMYADLAEKFDGNLSFADEALKGLSPKLANDIRRLGGELQSKKQSERVSTALAGYKSWAEFMESNQQFADPAAYAQLVGLGGKMKDTFVNAVGGADGAKQRLIDSQLQKLMPVVQSGLLSGTKQGYADAVAAYKAQFPTGDASLAEQRLTLLQKELQARDSMAKADKMVETNVSRRVKDHEENVKAQASETMIEGMLQSLNFSKTEASRAAANIREASLSTQTPAGEIIETIKGDKESLELLKENPAAFSSTWKAKSKESPVDRIYREEKRNANLIYPSPYAASAAAREYSQIVSIGIANAEELLGSGRDTKIIAPKLLDVIEQMAQVNQVVEQAKVQNPGNRDIEDLDRSITQFFSDPRVRSFLEQPSAPAPTSGSEVTAPTAERPLKFTSSGDPRVKDVLEKAVAAYRNLPKPQGSAYERPLWDVAFGTDAELRKVRSRFIDMGSNYRVQQELARMFDEAVR